MSLLNFAPFTRFNIESEIMTVAFSLHDLNPHLAFVSGFWQPYLLIYDNVKSQIHKVPHTGFL